MTPSILLMWSGGISSTALLLKYLTNSEYADYDIIVHHLHIRDYRNKAMAEAEACKSIIKYIQDKKKYRHFFFSESNHDYNFIAPPRYMTGMDDFTLIGHVVATMSRCNSDIEKVIIGTTKTDVDRSTTYMQRLERCQKVINAVMGATDYELSVEFPHADDSLGVVYDSIVRPLRPAPMSCEVPQHDEKTDTYLHCGSCAKCNSRQEFRLPTKYT